jgi:dTDP-4-dehydrorhamnose reductase
VRSNSSDGPGPGRPAPSPGADATLQSRGPAGTRPRVVVTGAAGMLGRAIVTRFAATHDVVPHTRADCDLAEADVTERWILERAPQTIVHCAAWTDVDGCEADPGRASRDNATATANVARAAARAGSALCQLSTDYVFDGEKPAPYVEDDSSGPLGVYGRTKWAAEEHVRASTQRAWIVRTSWVFGPGGRNFVKTITALLGERQEIRVVEDQRGSPTYTLDLASGLYHVVTAGRFGTYHVTNTGACSWYEFAVAIASRLRSRCRILPCSTAEFPRPARRPRNSVLEPRFYRAQGLPEMRPWQDGMNDYLALLQAESIA